MKSSHFRSQDIKMFLKISSVCLAAAVAVSLSACNEKPATIKSPAVQNPVSTIDVPPPSKWDVFSSKSAGVYSVDGEDYLPVLSQGLKETRSSHNGKSGVMKYIDGNLLTVTTEEGKASFILKGKTVDRISARSVALTTDAINLAFVGDNGSKASFGKSLSVGDDYVTNNIDDTNLTRVTFHAVQNGERVLKNVVLTARIDGEYVYVPLDLK